MNMLPKWCSCRKKIDRETQRLIDNNPFDGDLMDSSFGQKPFPRKLSSKQNTQNQTKRLPQIIEEEEKAENIYATGNSMNLSYLLLNGQSAIKNHETNKQVQKPNGEKIIGDKSTLIQDVESKIISRPIQSISEKTEVEKQHDNSILEKLRLDESSIFVDAATGACFKVDPRLKERVAAEASQIANVHDLGIEPSDQKSSLFVNTESRIFYMVNPKLEEQILQNGTRIETVEDVVFNGERSDLFMEAESKIIYRVPEKLKEQIESEENRINNAEVSKNESNFFLDTESRIIYKIKDKGLQDEIQSEPILSAQNGYQDLGENQQSEMLQSEMAGSLFKNIDEISLKESMIPQDYNPIPDDISVKDFSLRDSNYTVYSDFTIKLKDSILQNEISTKKNPYQTVAAKTKSIIQKTKQEFSVSQPSIFGKPPEETLYARRYGISIFEQDLLDLREGSTNMSKMMKFYLRYLEDKVKNGLGVPKASSVKALDADFYDFLCKTENFEDIRKKYFDSSDQRPLIEQFERIIFLVHSGETNRWYIVVYNKQNKTISILSPEEASKRKVTSANIILNYQEKNNILSNIFEYFAKDYVEQTSEGLVSSDIHENYITDIPHWQNSEDYGFFVLEMMRRVFYGYDLKAPFEKSNISAFRSKFCDFIKHFGEQTKPEFKYDHHL